MKLYLFVAACAAAMTCAPASAEILWTGSSPYSDQLIGKGGGGSWDVWFQNYKPADGPLHFVFAWREYYENCSLGVCENEGGDANADWEAEYTGGKMRVGSAKIEAPVFNGSIVIASYWSISALSGGDPTKTYKLMGVQVDAIPEPATWAMMLIGFGAMGVAMRRRGASKVTLSYA